MGDDHDEEDGGGNKRMRRRSLQNKRLMRVSTRPRESTKEPTKLDQRYEGDIGVWVQKLQGDAGKQLHRKPDELGSGSADTAPQHKRQKQDSLVDIYGEETDHILETLHRLKRWMRRMWRWGQCYTQYCYPSLRTVEYYRKVKEHQKQKKKKCAERRANRNLQKPDDTGGKKAAAASAPVLIPSDNSKDKTEMVEIESKTEREDPCPKNTSPQNVNYMISDSDEMLMPVKLAMNEDSDDSLLSWTEYISKQFHDITRTMALYFSNDEGPFQITMFFRWMCYFFLPAVLFLGVHYVFLKRKYKSLSGKLKRIKDENNVLIKESNKLESMLINAEQLTMSMSTKESRAQAVSDFTRLSESLMNSKKEMNQMKTEKAALHEELKMARRRRDEAQKQYTSLTHGIVQNEHCVPT